MPLAALAHDSAAIADAVAAAAEPGKYSTGETADAWLMRRVRMRRTKNMTVSPRRPLARSRPGGAGDLRRSSASRTQGPDAWRQGLGTEHDVRAQTAVAREVPAY